MNVVIENVVVKTRQGEVRGSAIDGVNSFKGIPYAAPPFGANRLRPPQPVEAWSGVRDALNFGPTVPQPTAPSSLDDLLPNPNIPGEDCLNLNIWSPELGAISQSGAAHHTISTATARRVGRHLAKKLGVAATREAIAAVPVDRLLQAQAELNADLVADPDPEYWGREVVAAMLLWQPVVDGDVIPAPPIDRIAAGAGAGIEVLVGTNTDEHRAMLVPGGVIDRVTPDALAKSVADYGLPVEATLFAYRALHPGASSGDLLAAIRTEPCVSISHRRS